MSMNQYVLKVDALIVVDSDGDADMVADNFYARLSELVQSEDHMLDAIVVAFPMPGNRPPERQGILA